jgi:hypothetical protein
MCRMLRTTPCIRVGVPTPGEGGTLSGNGGAPPVGVGVLCGKSFTQHPPAVLVTMLYNVSKSCVGIVHSVLGRPLRWH